MEDEKLLENSEYTIYKAKNYCAVIPNNPTGPINILVDLHQGNLINGENETIVNATTEEYNKLKGTISNGLLILPQINEEAYSNALKDENKAEMLNIAKIIGTITKELDKKVANIKHEITIVERNNDDEKYVENISQNIAAIFKGLPFKEEQKEIAPSTIEEPPKEENPIASMDIFGSAEATTPPVEEPKIETPTPVVEEKEEQPVANTDIFGTETTKTQEHSTPVVEEMKAEPTAAESGLFGTTAIPTIPTTEAPAPVVEEKEETSVVPEEKQSESVQAPKPLEEVELHTGETTAIPTIKTPEAPAEAPAQTQGPVLVRKKGNGFANLAILLVVLVVVTIISIEFGKFLYSVYGA